MQQQEEMEVIMALITEGSVLCGYNNQTARRRNARHDIFKGLSNLRNERVIDKKSLQAVLFAVFSFPHHI